MSDQNQAATAEKPALPVVPEAAKTPAVARPVVQLLATEPVERRLKSLLHGTGLSLDKLRRVVIEQVTRNPKLGEPKRMKNLLLAICDAAKLGLLPDGVLGTGALVPVGDDEVQFRPMYKGLLKLTWQSGLISSIHATIVYEGEPFVLERGLNQRLEHTELPPSQRGEPIGCYVVATWRDGRTKTWDYMWKEDIEAIRDRYSDAYNSTMQRVNEGKLKIERAKNPWITEPLEMWKKTVLKRVLKSLPADTVPYLAAQMDDFSEATGAAVHLQRNYKEDGLTPATSYRGDADERPTLESAAAPVVKDGAPTRVQEAVGAKQPEPAQAQPQADEAEQATEEDGSEAPDPALFIRIELARKGKGYDWAKWRATFSERLAQMQTEQQVRALVGANDETIRFMGHIDQQLAEEVEAEVNQRIADLTS